MRGRLNKYAPFAAFPVLALQNLLIFWGHYFKHKVFPWDFPLGYYAFPAYWTSSVELGKFPQWVPFQAMGYPFAMNLQTGLYYPPLWIFPLFGHSYTLRAAVIMQCLHVLAGSIGMYLFLKLKLRSPYLALAGAFAFQFFGGFYSNSEHLDIVRACAFAPWLFYVFSLAPGVAGNWYLPRRALFIPLAVYMLATGGYPGNLISFMFILSLYVSLQLLDKNVVKGIRAKAVVAVAVLFLTALGLAMAFVHLGPSWIERAQLTRYDKYAKITKMGFGLAHLPGLFLSNRSLPGEISMTSAYITLPVLVFLSFLPIKKLREHWYLAATGAIAFLMAGGSGSFVYRIVTNVISPLGFSRMPSSDYRVLFAIVIVVFGMMGLEAVVYKGPAGFSKRSMFILFWVTLGAVLCYANPNVWGQSAPPGMAVILKNMAYIYLVAAAAVVLVRYAATRKKEDLSYLAMIALILISIDGYRVVSDMKMEWRVDDYKKDGGYNYLSDYGYIGKGKDKLYNYYMLQHPPEKRPARLKPVSVNDFCTRGYLAGNYVTKEVGNTMLMARQNIEKNPLYMGYMLREWTPLILDPEVISNGSAAVPDDIFKSALASPDTGAVRQLCYRPDEISYNVSLDKPKLMVENEIYFDGWQARLSLPGKDSIIKPIEINNGFRAWLLPAGKYNMVSIFNFPHYSLYRTISLSALALWGIILLFAFRRQTKLVVNDMGD